MRFALSDSTNSQARASDHSAELQQRAYLPQVLPDGSASRAAGNLQQSRLRRRSMAMDRERFFPLQGILGVVNGNVFTGQPSQFGQKNKDCRILYLV